MDWTAVRLCEDCGAGCPADASKCIHCASTKLGPAQSPPPPSKTILVEDVEAGAFKELCALACPNCNVQFKKETASSSMEAVRKAAAEKRRQARSQGLELIIEPVYPLKCESCHADWDYDSIRKTFIRHQPKEQE